MKKRIDQLKIDRLMAAVGFCGAWDALKYAHRYYGDAFIGGGLLRDLLHGVAPKDIDIFTFSPTILIPGAKGMREEAEKRSDDEPPDLANDALQQAYESTRIIEVEKPVIDRRFEFPVQIVHLRAKLNDMDCGAASMQEAVSQFSLGLQQLAVTRGAGLFATEAFHRDYENETMTVCYCDHDDEADRIKRKFDALHSRYPAHRLVIPKKFHSYFVEFSNASL